MIGVVLIVLAVYSVAVTVAEEDVIVLKLPVFVTVLTLGYVISVFNELASDVPVSVVELKVIVLPVSSVTADAVPVISVPTLLLLVSNVTVLVEPVSWVTVDVEPVSSILVVVVPVYEVLVSVPSETVVVVPVCRVLVSVP